MFLRQKRLAVISLVVLLISFATTVQAAQLNLSAKSKIQTQMQTSSVVAVLDVIPSSIVTSTTVKGGTKDVPVLAVNLRAINSSVVLNSLTFTRFTTLSPTIDVQSFFTLKNGDGSDLISYKKVFDPSNPNKLNFSALNLTIKQNEIKTIIVKADLGNLSAQPYNFYLDLANESEVSATLTTPPKLIKNPQVIVNDGDGANYRDSFDGPNKNGSVKITVESGIIGSGTISFLNPPVLVRSAEYPAGSTNVLAARFQAVALNENFEIQKLSIRLAYATSDAYLSQVKIKFPTDLNNPLILDGQATSYVARKVGDNYTAYDFSNLNFKVPQNSNSVVFEIYIDIKSSAKTKDPITFYLSATRDDKFQAMGLSSGTIINQGNWFVPSPTQIWIK